MNPAMSLKNATKKIVYVTLRLLFIIVSKILFRYEVRGAEHIPSEGAAIIASNHTSYLDPPFIGMGISRPIFYFAKQELFRNFFFRTIIDLVNAIPVNRSQLDRKTLRKILNLLNHGEVLLMFPEGARSLTDDINPAKPGIGFIAYKARVSIIPAYIQGSFDILPRKKKYIRLKKCIVHFGPQIPLERLFEQEKSKELYERISREIMAGIKKLKDDSLQQKAG